MDGLAKRKRRKGYHILVVDALETLPPAPGQRIERSIALVPPSVHLNNLATQFLPSEASGTGLQSVVDPKLQ